MILWTTRPPLSGNPTKRLQNQRQRSLPSSTLNDLPKHYQYTITIVEKNHQKIIVFWQPLSLFRSRLLFARGGMLDCRILWSYRSPLPLSCRSLPVRRSYERSLGLFSLWIFKRWLFGWVHRSLHRCWPWLNQWGWCEPFLRLPYRYRAVVSLPLIDYCYILYHWYRPWKLLCRRCCIPSWLFRAASRNSYWTCLSFSGKWSWEGWVLGR